MLKRFLALIAAAVLMVCLTAVAWADYDYIDAYYIDVTPDTEDGSLLISVELTWTALEELPYGQELKIGIPNGSVREETALTDNISQLMYDGSYMYVYLDRGYDEGETFTFAYSWVQEYMYTLGDDGSVSYDYTPGWFDEAKVGEMTVTWHDPEGLIGDFGGSSGAMYTVLEDGLLVKKVDLSYGEQISVTASYDQWPTVLDSQYSAGKYDGDWDMDWDDDYYYYDDYQDTVSDMIASVITVIVLVVILMVVVNRSRRSYRGGFGTRYVFVDHLWYPAGPDGKPRPGSVGVKERPRPPKSSGGGFGGGSRGGGFGGGGFSGGSHCACASSCACACACACAGGGRAGCSAKNLYGAVKLNAALPEKTRE